MKINWPKNGGTIIVFYLSDIQNLTKASRSLCSFKIERND